MQDLQLLIQKYWAGTATKEEQQLLWELLGTREPRIKEWLETEYDKDNADQTKFLSALRSEEILQQIQDKKERRTPKPLPRGRIRSTGIPGDRGRSIGMPGHWVGWAAASVILLTIGVSLLRYVRHNPANPGIAEKTARLTPELERVSNTGAEEMKITLSDHSEVLLQPHSSISYYQSFESARRDISLCGAARFKVARDPVRSFTVYAGEIATTALGTEFSVSTFMSNKVEVKLLEGKVKVYLVGQSFTMNDVYLKPGQEFTIDMQLRQFVVQEFNNKQAPSLHEKKGTGDDAGSNKAVLTFDKEPLMNVFEKVGEQYNIHFLYNQQDVKGLRFTGTFLASDSLPVVIAVICNMNGLTFRQDKTNITISKLK